MPGILGDDFTSELSSFVASLDFEDLPGDSVRLVERAILDTVGVTLAGSSTDVVNRVARMVDRERGETNVLGRNSNLPLHDAVFLNATAGHCLDFDDVSLTAMNGHPSVPLVSPLLAIADRTGSTGKELITAYAAGFETQCYISRPISPGHYERGWHATSTIGTFGSTAAVAKLLGCSELEVRNALQIAASMPAGSKRNFGSMTKPLQVGQAARSGTTAALSAAEGVTGSRGALKRDGGFLDLYSGNAEPDPECVPDLGERWALEVDGIDAKKYPCCHYAHAAIYAAIQLAEAHDIAPTAVDEVVVESSQGADDALKYRNPTTELEAKFSMEYLVARGVVDRQFGLSAFDDDCLEDPDVERVRERISFVVDDGLSYESNAARIRLTTRSGERFRMDQDQPPGTHKAPLSEAEIKDKYRMCAGRSVAELDVAESLILLDSLRTVDEISVVVETL
jgi:2-methylcitrate dehydratase PrpD